MMCIGLKKPLFITLDEKDLEIVLHF